MISPDYNKVSTLEEVVVSKTNIVLFNDDFNTFDHVIDCLIKYCKHTFEQAEQCAYLVHYCGKCHVKSGTIEELVPICRALIDEGLTASIA